MRRATLFHHLTDTTKLHTILAERDRIFREYNELHSHPAYVETLKQERPYIYDRALWEIRALNLALGYEASAGRAKHVEDAREQKVRDLDRRARDEMALAAKKLDSVEAFEAMLDERPNLDPDVRDVIVLNFKEALDPPRSVAMKTV